MAAEEKSTKEIFENIAILDLKKKKETGLWISVSCLILRQKQKGRNPHEADPNHIRKRITKVETNLSFVKIHYERNAIEVSFMNETFKFHEQNSALSRNQYNPTME
jgi:hypothetical protein